MPKINRMRIVNFSYNNNNRHILDETFDFFGGENVLFSLANGGGKSVLVQAMLQPILPKASLLGRKIGDFFAGRNAPSYILLEWKLDDSAGYLLTGIGIMPNATHSANEEEQTTNIRYFTFFHEYDEGNALDIRHIPVTEQIGSHLKIASFSEFRKYMKKEEDKSQYRMRVFASDREEQREYERKLSSYGISTDEWKDLMVRINEAEHGVSEVFTKCKTSKMVMEQWVIKYIEDVLNKSSSEHSDHEKLEAMMSQVAEAKVENEHHIKEYEKISAFISDARELYDETKAILSSLDEEAHMKRRIRTGLHVLSAEESRLDDESQKLAADNIQLNSDIRQIELEKKSLEIYGYLKELRDIEDILAFLDNKLAQKNAVLQEAEHSLIIQKAAERFETIREKEQRLTNLRERLANAMKDEEKLAKDLNQVKYSLKLLYEKVLDVYAANIKSSFEAESLHRLRISAFNKEIDKSQVDLRGLERDLGGYNIIIRGFEEKEPAIFEQLGIELYRNPLIQELDSKDIASASDKLESDVSNIRAHIEYNIQEIENKEKEMIQLEMDKEELARKQSDANSELTRIGQVISGFEEEREGILDILRVYNIPESELFDKGGIMRQIQEKISSWSRKSFHLRMSITDAEKLLHGIEEGISYLPPRLAALLKEHNLPCYTGEQYLKEVDSSRRKALLEKNPLLPYALILTEREYDKIADLLKGEELSQIVPVIRYQNRESLGMENGNPEMVVRFFTTARMMRLDDESRNAYIQQLTENKEAMLVELEQAEKTLEVSHREYQTVNQFGWERDQADALYKEKARLERLLVQLGDEADEIRRWAEDCRTHFKNLNHAVDMLEKDLVVALQRKDKFNEYIEEDSRYMENMRKASKVKAEISRIQSKINDMKEEASDEEKQRSTAAEELASARRQKNAVEEKYDMVKDAIAVHTLDEQLHDLEGKLKAYLSKQTSEGSGITEQIDILIREIKTENRQLQKLELVQEEYENVVYNESMEQRLESDIKVLKAEINTLMSKFHEEDKNKREAETKRDRAKAELNGEPLVPVEKIRGDFDTRSINLREKIRENNVREAKIQKLFIRITELSTKIKTGISDIMNIDVDSAAIKAFAEVEEEIEVLLSQYEETVKATNKSIGHFNKKSVDLKTKYQQDQMGIVSEAFKSIQAQVDGLSRTYDKYYYLSERLDSCSIKLDEVLKIMEEKVLQLEHDQKDLSEHAFMEAMRIYREIPRISENSSVMIDGERKKILEIQFDKVEDELAAKEKMSGYINDCLNTLTKLIKDKEDSNRTRRELEKFISTKELLNVISSLENYVVKAYKVDLNERNRKMMPWEDIIVKNSGGEKFVAYFSLLVALISYSRGRSRDTFLKKEDTKVLIMDNPFGPITSGHLLKPMFDIAEKYDTQLICLSDIKQGSVIGRFKLIYMVKIRQNMMHDEYLEFEPHILADLKADERLENAMIHSYIQTNIFHQ